ncbi:TadE/TadG family type IV pilus assembly protein [Altererythrobacter sp. H2]|uniref:TadE/TadG family type IV pilus assembly protein n=1 Tax=Altererythrobacter sp. H2 TaxID=3108391 RepID=UPI002B4BE512|nr:TadE/TadG family type IV pilus assembly protein [Altererythrobacter sp. H2]WRK94344.1 TadE/TadG family type IV pilus assembly protein [Altererythrobacter sp. H2]
MRRIRSLRQLLRARGGSVIIEFALLAPVMFMLMFGVFQVAIYVQNYNAVRSVVSDTARFVAVEYQKGNDLAPLEIHAVMVSIATAAPYMLDSDRLEIDIQPVVTSRVAGANEFSIDVDYTLESFLPFADLGAATLTYERPVFVVAPTAP